LFQDGRKPDTKLTDFYAFHIAITHWHATKLEHIRIFTRYDFW